MEHVVPDTVLNGPAAGAPCALGLSCAFTVSRHVTSHHRAVSRRVTHCRDRVNDQLGRFEIVFS